MILSDDNCSFCSEFNNVNNELNYFLNKCKGHFKSNDRTIQTIGNWRIMPTAGCFVEGYILLVHKSHFTSFANCTMLDKLAAVNQIELCKKMFNEVYKSKFVIFEHGITQDTYRGSCCIDHVHLHMIPLNQDIWNEILKIYKFKSYKIDNLLYLSDFLSKNGIKSYLLYQNVDESIYVIDATFDIYPSQFFRQILFPLLNKSDNKDSWDWRHYNYVNNMVKTYSDIHTYIDAKGWHL